MTLSRLPHSPDEALRGAALCFVGALQQEKKQIVKKYQGYFSDLAGVNSSSPLLFCLLFSSLCLSISLSTWHRPR